MKFSLMTSLVGLLTVVSANPIPENIPRNTATTCSNRGISASRAQAVAAAFTNARLTPQAITSGINPKVEVSVAYGSHAVNLGNTFSITETVNRPTIKFTAEQNYDPASTKYLILFVDPDAPGPTSPGSPALLSFFLHQATYNCAPSCISSANNGGGTDITVPAYRALTPLSVSPHRYTQLVYRQPPGFTPPATLAATTAGFDLNGFVKANNLVLVGGNFFRAGALST